MPTCSPCWWNNAVRTAPARDIGKVELAGKPGGRVVLLENNFISIPVLGWFVKLVNPTAVRMIGADFSRYPEKMVAESGLELERVTDLGRGLWKLIEARKKPELLHKCNQFERRN